MPGRRPVGEGFGRGRRARDHRCPAPPQLALLVAHLVPEAEARAHELAEQRGQRARAAVRDAVQQLGAAVEHPAAPPARGVQDGRQRRAQLVEHGRADRDVEVAHAVQVGDGPPAAAVAVGARRRPTGDLLEYAVELVERGGDVVAAARRHGVARAPRGGPGRPCRRAAGAARARGTGPSAAACDPRRGGDASIAHVSKCTTRSRCSAPERTRRVALLGERAPRQRPEEADRVVLRAVALPVGGDVTSVQRRRRDGLPAAPAASLSTARASDSRLCHATASRNAGSRATSASRGSSPGPKTSSPSPGSRRCGPRSPATGSSRP